MESVYSENIGPETSESGTSSGRTSETVEASGDAVIVFDALNNIADAMNNIAAAIREHTKETFREEDQELEQQLDMDGNPI